MISTPNGTARSLASSRSRSSPSCSTTASSAALARAAEQEARVEDDGLGARCLRDAGRVVEHADGHAVLLVALDMAHEPGDRRVHRERDAGARARARRGARRTGSPSRSRPRSRSRRPCSRARSSSSIASSGLPVTARAPARSGCVPITAADVPQPGSVRRASYAFPWPEPLSNRPAGARHRPPARRPLARGGRGRRVESRGRGRVHAGRVRQGVLRRPDRGRPGRLCEDHGYGSPVGASRRPPDAPLGTSSRACVRSAG